MATKKTLSLIHLTRAMALGDRLSDPEAQLEMAAVYLAPAGELVKARKNADALDPFITQAAELNGEEAAELLSDFLQQFGKYSATLLVSGQRPMPIPETEQPQNQSPENS